MAGLPANNSCQCQFGNDTTGNVCAHANDRGVTIEESQVLFWFVHTRLQPQKRECDQMK